VFRGLAVEDSARNAQSKSKTPLYVDVHCAATLVAQDPARGTQCARGAAATEGRTTCPNLRLTERI